MGVRVCTASQVKTWWSVEDFDLTVIALNNCYECNTRGHIRRHCPSIGQPRLMYSEEELDYMVNPLGYCWKCNQPGHVRIKCPNLGQSRKSYKSRGKAEDVCCYNCNNCRHYSRDCLLPKRTRKEQRPQGVEDEC